MAAREAARDAVLVDVPCLFVWPWACAWQLVRANAPEALGTHACLWPKLGLCAINLRRNQHKRVTGQLTIGQLGLSCAQLLAECALAEPRCKPGPWRLGPTSLMKSRAATRASAMHASFKPPFLSRQMSPPRCSNWRRCCHSPQNHSSWGWGNRSGIRGGEHNEHMPLWPAPSQTVPTPQCAPIHHPARPSARSGSASRGGRRWGHATCPIEQSTLFLVRYRVDDTPRAASLRASLSTPDALTLLSP